MSTVGLPAFPGVRELEAEAVGSQIDPGARLGRKLGKFSTGHVTQGKGEARERVTFVWASEPANPGAPLARVLEGTPGPRKGAREPRRPIARLSGFPTAR